MCLIIRRYCCACYSREPRKQVFSMSSEETIPLLYHFQGLLKNHLVTCEEAGGIARDMTEQGKCQPWIQEEAEKSMAALMCLPSPSQREGWRRAVFLPLLYWVSWKSYSHPEHSTHLQRKKAGRRVWLTPLSRLLGSQAAAEARNLWGSPPTQWRASPFSPTAESARLEGPSEKGQILEISGLVGTAKEITGVQGETGNEELAE